MCDLIDLNSPNAKTLLGPKLASPLIPVPDTGNQINQVVGGNSLITGKRNSLENNPFDTVLHKTTEYIQKKDDPFEVALEKALKTKTRKKKVSQRTGSFDFTDDCTPRRKKNTQMFKMNRTLDESMMNIETPVNVCQKRIAFETEKENAMVNLNNSVEFEKDFMPHCDNLSATAKNSQIPSIDVQCADLSILNQSVMNDTLSESSWGLDKDQTKPVLHENINEVVVPEHVGVLNVNLKIPKFRRSLSQGDKISPRKILHLNRLSQSIKDTLRLKSTGSNSTASSALSSNSVDLLNDGFLNSQNSINSVLSSLSDVSAITRLNSVCSSTGSSIASSNGTINRTFLESCLSDKPDVTRLTEIMDIYNEINSVGPKSGTPITSTSTEFVISDLVDRFSKLHANLSPMSMKKNSENKEGSIPSCASNNLEENVVAENESTMQSTDNKLIDIDVFKLQANHKELSKSSISDTSSDSVFSEGNKINKSILHEAKALAKTFEELALRTSSESNTNDLITSNPSWTSELLPAFDDDAIDNLIELPSSPNTNIDNTNANHVNEDVHHKNGDKNESIAHCDVQNDDIIKDLETQLIDPSDTEKKVVAATLLLDLKKLIKSENNTEANKLLENLEKVLGIQYKNNTELLATYLNTTNNLAKSPQKLKTNVEIVKNVNENTAENQEKDLNTDSVDNINLNSISTDKYSDNDLKFLKQSNSGLESPAANNSVELINTSKENKENPSNKTEKSDSTSEKQPDNSSNEKMAWELLANLGRLLNGQAEEESTLDLLKNLGQVLNIASGNYNVNSKTETDSTYAEIQQTPKKRGLKSESKARTSILSKSTNRLSLDLAPKKKSTPSLLRKSISVSHSPPMKVTPSPLISKKNTSQLKDVKKRFPSDPGLTNTVSVKKFVDSDTSKVCNPGKSLQTKSITVFHVQEEKPAAVGPGVKSKLKRKTDIDVPSRKGPLKAIIPLGNMHRGSLNKKTLPSIRSDVTPPKLHHIISSTPNSTDSEYLVKKSPRTRPVASSTPDAQNSKSRKLQSQPSNCPKKRNFYSDISPVTPVNNVSSILESPKRSIKFPSPKRTTPKRRQADSNIPKSQTSPLIRRASFSFNAAQHEPIPVSPQNTLKKKLEPRKNSPIPLKKNADRTQRSPLKDSNKLSPKVKPFNLISKIQRHSTSNG